MYNYQQLIEFRLLSDS